MLGASADHFDLVVMELHWMDLDWLVHVVLLPCSEHIVVAHTPRVNLVARWYESIAVVAASCHQ